MLPSSSSSFFPKLIRIRGFFFFGIEYSSSSATSSLSEPDISSSEESVFLRFLRLIFTFLTRTFFILVHFSSLLQASHFSQGFNRVVISSVTPSALSSPLFFRLRPFFFPFPL